MTSALPPESASFPFPTQIVYEESANRLRVTVDVAPATVDDLTVEVGPSRLRIAVDRGDEIADRTITPLPRHLVFGDDREGRCNNGVLSLSLETRPRRRSRRTR
ncbi:Hsp20/alpha crystallin family protein [Natrinema caseinilyticum]|uniref:Hsp20/alpha crystallin family protein n=1 Tax=Natrinema caseinilyticum TaxID=2961570 RepID=UPI0020C2DCC6|nr:Hsp20/alpha crystallin family protein [Natrinema caseinilyticum]